MKIIFILFAIVGFTKVKVRASCPINKPVMRFIILRINGSSRVLNRVPLSTCHQKNCLFVKWICCLNIAILLKLFAIRENSC